MAGLFSTPSTRPPSPTTKSHNSDPPTTFQLSVEATGDAPAEPVFTPAPSFKLARTSSFRYPGWKPTPPSEKRRGSVVTANLSPNDTSETAEYEPLPPNPHFAPANPLSRSRLARIANSLGVQVPTPASVADATSSQSASSLNGNSLVRSSSSPSNPTPQSNHATRFLLHVIPPLQLQPPDNPKFMRGTFIPLYATLPSQLNAIAREYSLPSTGGLVVYLLDATHSSFGEDGIGDEWLGPRIGEEAWKLLWSGVLKAERELWSAGQNRQLMSPGPGQLSGLSTSQSSPSITSSLQILPSPPVSSPGLDANGDSQGRTTPSLRPLLTAQIQASNQAAASPSFSSSSTTTSSHSAFAARSDSPASIRTNTTATSTTTSLLPALPIVGKIEFDVDRSRANWYDTFQPRQRSKTDAPSPAMLERGISPTPYPAPIPKTFLASASRAASPNLVLSPIGTLHPGSPGVGSGKRFRRSPLLQSPESAYSEPLADAASSSSGMLTPASAKFSPSTEPNGKAPRNSLQLGGLQSGSEESDGAEASGQLTPPGASGSESEGDGPELSDSQDGYTKMEDEEEDEDRSFYPDDDVSNPPPLSSLEASPVNGFIDESIQELEDEPMGGEPVQVPSPQDESDSALPLPEHKDPLADVFPSDSQTWHDLKDDLSAAHSSDHPDRAAYVGSSPDLTDDDTQSIENTSADFQEVLDMLNGPSPHKAEVQDFVIPPSTSTLESDGSSTTQLPPLSLGSPIVLDEPSSPATSPKSVSSMDLKGNKRPPPLNFSSLESGELEADPVLTPTPGLARLEYRGDSVTPVRGLATSDANVTETHPEGLSLAYLGSPLPPMTPDNRDESVSFDDDDDGQMMNKHLDLLEKSISQLSPREISPATPSPLSASPFDRITRRATGGSLLNGTNGPRFRSEALGAELASRIKGESPSQMITISEDPNSSAPSWPAVPFNAGTPQPPSPLFPPTPAGHYFSEQQNSSVSDETRKRIRLAAEEEEINASKKYRPPTPGASVTKNADQQQHRFINPQRQGSLTSPKKSRFSIDSTPSEEGSNTANPVPGRSSSIMSRSIRKLWRKGGTAAQVVTSKPNTPRSSTTIIRESSPPPPLPSTPLPPTRPSMTETRPAPQPPTNSARPSLSDPSTETRSNSRQQQNRPDSGLDPFVFDQDSRYPTLRSPSPTSVNGAPRNGMPRPAPAPPVQVAPQYLGAQRTKSILKGRRASPPIPAIAAPPPPEKEERGLSGFFGRRKSNTTQPNGGVEVEVAVEVRHDEDAKSSKKKKSPPTHLTTSTTQGGLSSFLPQPSPSPAALSFPRTASPPRSSFDIEDVQYRPSMENSSMMSGDMSQFEMVTPPTRSYDLEEDERIAKPAR